MINYYIFWAPLLLSILLFDEFESFFDLLQATKLKTIINLEKIKNYVFQICLVEFLAKIKVQNDDRSKADLRYCPGWLRATGKGSFGHDEELFVSRFVSFKL